VLREAGIEPGEDPAAEADWTPGAAAATRLLLECDPAMTAVFVHSDAMAIGVLSALARAGRRVPDDVAVVSCDDMPFAEVLIPSLTSLRLPFAESGEVAVELLLGRITGQPPLDEPILLPVGLVVRGSCGGQPAASAPTTWKGRTACPGSSLTPAGAPATWTATYSGVSGAPWAGASTAACTTA